MLFLDYARQRVDSFLHQIERLKDGDFPHPHSKEALDFIAQVFTIRKATLDGLTPKNQPHVIETACSEAWVQIYNLHP